eukprot:CAMPEP_0202443122 /NCGR_PEP_ID=MMETSP1360-20130828/2475_1 /ASSEMBLY_ACC=CAM_ASM_000848 /TAXON_ID=515479 /ORGANISM="Licmophora paradoxa, Strain CCMP2313" /LENGTH=61 /DNA_ID=CAMNT_0049058717 /DNA_START=46 /DNA_END=228 /DNA_ORIENTATION=+
MKVSVIYFACSLLSSVSSVVGKEKAGTEALFNEDDLDKDRELDVLPSTFRTPPGMYVDVTD